MENKMQICQSCGMPLNFKEESFKGTEKDGSLSSNYCKTCYVNGEYSNPDMTIDQMLEWGVKGIKASPTLSDTEKENIIKHFTKDSLKSLNRWKNK